MDSSLYKLRTNLIYGLCAVLSGIVLCMILMPKGLTANSGVSYYGVQTRTVLILGISFMLCSYFLVRAALSLTNIYPDWIIREVLYIYAVLIIIIALTPYTAGRYVSDLHIASGLVLFLMQFILAIWFCFVLYKNNTNYILLLVLALAGIVSLYYNQSSKGYLLETQLVFQVIFFIIFIRTTKILEANVNELPQSH